MKSLRSKLLLVILPVIFVALSLVAFINHNKAKDFLEEEFSDKAEISLEKARSDINKFFEQKVREVEILAHTKVAQSMNAEEAIPYLISELERLQDFEMFGLTHLDGTSPTTFGSTANISDRGYFQETISTKETVVSEVIISRASEEMIVAIGSPIFDKETLIGVLVATVPVESIVQLVSEYKIGDNGYAFLVNKDGTVIAHPNSDLIMETNLLESDNEQLKNIITNALRGETNTTMFNDNGIESYAYYTSIPSTNMGLVISAPHKEVTGNLSYLAMLSFVTAGVILIFSFVVVFLFARSLVNPIKRLSELTTSVAEGDLTVSTSNTYSKDEVGILGSNFDKMVKKIQELLSKIDVVSSSVKDSADVMLNSSTETKQAAEQVAVTINELAMGTTDIADSVTNTTEQMNTMLSTVDQISTFTNEVLNTSSNSKESASRGLQSTKLALEKMHDVRDKVKETSITIDKLDHQSQEIGNIIQMITNIAEQTNLLALNASIEAARAGDHGKGFAVVANEVRKLANETSESADKIAALIKDTQEESRRAVSSIKIGEEVVVEGTETVQEASKAFSEIAGYIDEVLSKNQNIYSSVQDLQRFGSEIGNNMENISAVTEQASAGAQEVSATTQQQASTANQIAGDAENLAELANQLREVMSKFKTN